MRWRLLVGLGGVHFALVGCDSVADSDAAGDTDGGVVTDRVAPETSITRSPEAVSTVASARLEFASDDISATFVCRLDGAEAAPCASPTDFVELTEGTHRFEVAAVDAAGNQDPSPASVEWSIRLSAPDTSMVSAPSDPSNSAQATFEFSSTFDGSAFRCSLDGSEVTPCTSPYAVAGLAEGIHEFSVAAVDAFGAADPSPALHRWYAHVDAPETSITRGPPDPSRDADTNIRFVADVEGSTFRCRLDDAAAVACASPWALSGLAIGGHRVEVAAVDTFGLEDPTPAIYEWTYAPGPLDTVLTSGPSDPSASNSATFWFHANVPGASFRCSVDGSPEEACAPPFDIGGLSEGQHVFRVHATLPDGRVDPSPVVRVWRVDSVPPTTIVSSGPAAASSDERPTFAFTSTEADSRFMCRMDDSVLEWCTSPYTASVPLDEGEHTFFVAAVDSAGNMDPAPPTTEWTVDLTPPEVQAVQFPKAFTFFDRVRVAIVTEDDVEVECILDGVSTECAWDDAEVLVGEEYIEALASRLDGLEEGPHDLELIVRDAAGNEAEAELSWSWRYVEPWEPVAEIPGHGTADFGLATSIGSRIYFANGRQGGFSSYDLESGESRGETNWSDFCGCGAIGPMAAAGGKIWYFGNQVGVYDPVTKVWGTAPYPPNGYGEPGIMVLDDRIYKLGARDYSGWDRAKFDVLDSSSGEWLADPGIPDYPWRTQGASLIPYKGSIWGLGGYTTSYSTQKMAVYDPAAGVWEVLPEIPWETWVSWTVPAAVEVADRFLVRAYYYDEVEETDYEIFYLYDPATRSWSDYFVPALSEVEYGTGTPVRVGSDLYFVANRSGDTEEIAVIYKFIPFWD